MISHRPTFGDTLAHVSRPRFDGTAPARLVQPIDNSPVYPMRTPRRLSWSMALLVSALLWGVVVLVIRWWLS